MLKQYYITNEQDLKTIDQLVQEHVLKVYEICNRDKTRTAAVLGITVKHLYNLLHCYGR